MNLGQAVLLTVAAILSLSALLIGTARPAVAHGSLLSSSPADSARLDVAPERVALRFSDEVQAESARIVIDGPTGRLPAYALRVDGARVAQSLPANLAAGEYSVTWRVLSSDGHPLSGRVGFVVRASQSDDEPSSESSRSEPTPVESQQQRSADRGGAGIWGALGVVAVTLLLVPALMARHRRPREDPEEPR